MSIKVKIDLKVKKQIIKNTCSVLWSQKYCLKFGYQISLKYISLYEEDKYFSSLVKYIMYVEQYQCTRPNQNLTIYFLRGYTGGPKSPKVFCQKILAIFAIFGDIGNMGTEILFFLLQKMKKCLGVRNNVMRRTIFQFYNVFYNRFE